MTTTTTAQPPRRQTPRPITERIGGYACEQCGLTTGTADHYMIVPTRLLPETTRRTIYGAGKPDAYTLLCEECDKRTQRPEEKHEEKRGQA
jgi:hypothetical protein